MPRILTETDLALLEGLPEVTQLARFLAQRAHIVAQNTRLLRYLTNVIAGEPENEMTAPTPEYGAIAMEVWDSLREQGIQTMTARWPAMHAEEIVEEFAEHTHMYDDTRVVAVLWAFEGDLKPAQLLLEEANVDSFEKPMVLHTEHYHGEVEH